MSTVTVMDDVASPMAGPAIATPAAPNTEQFVRDMMNGQPVLAAYMKAVASGDPDQITAVPAQYGYDVTSEGVATLDQAADPGPGFDIRMVGGLYRFEAPSDLSGKKMMVDASTGRLSIDGVWVGNKTDENGHVGFHYDNYDKLEYSLIFSMSYNDNGGQNPVTVTGKRGIDLSSSSEQEQDVSAIQLMDPSQWDALDLTKIFGLFSGGITFLLMVWKKAKKYREERAAEAKATLEELADHAKTMIKLRENLQDRGSAAAQASLQARTESEAREESSKGSEAAKEKAEHEKPAEFEHGE